MLCEWTVSSDNKIKSNAVIKQKDVRAGSGWEFLWATTNEMICFSALYTSFKNVTFYSNFKNAEYYIILDTVKALSLRKLAPLFNS